MISGYYLQKSLSNIEMTIKYTRVYFFFTGEPYFSIMYFFSHSSDCLCFDFFVWQTNRTVF